ncbi:unnamed protein product [Polarella glacialis]|uniref:Photosystem I reaction center subunit III n=1 Tax=Polarella glacialis TaxID=89957 RepID=A0A813FIK4_POLGL|nr:unnamed protein product [Polarella glacialis]
MARSRVVLLGAAAAASAAAVAFVAAPVSGGLRSPSFRTTGLAAQALPTEFGEASIDGPEATFEQSQFQPFLQWVGAGLLAGLVMAVCSAPAANANDLSVQFRGFQDFTIKKSAVLEPCGVNKKFAKRMKDEVYKIGAKQKKAAAAFMPVKEFDKKIEAVKTRQAAYADRFCGKKDGLPRTIATGELVRGGVVVPGLMFLYTAGWIGYAARSYLMRTGNEQKEMNIDVPLAVQCMASGFSWPVNAWQEIVNGDFVVPDRYVSPSGPTGNGS